jgi:hypothetical protein
MRTYAAADCLYDPRSRRTRELLQKWEAHGVAYEERRVELNQATLDEARQYGMMVPIVVWPDGRVEQGFEGNLGCFI